jgi:hypothetical protein
MVKIIERSRNLVSLVGPIVTKRTLQELLDRLADKEVTFSFGEQDEVYFLRDETAEEKAERELRYRGTPSEDLRKHVLEITNTVGRLHDESPCACEVIALADVKHDLDGNPHAVPRSFFGYGDTALVAQANAWQAAKDAILESQALLLVEDHASNYSKF